MMSPFVSYQRGHCELYPVEFFVGALKKMINYCSFKKNHGQKILKAYLAELL